jgi:hypothetical protein
MQRLSPEAVAQVQVMEEALHHIENGLVKPFCNTIELQHVHQGGGMLNAFF